MHIEVCSLIVFAKALSPIGLFNILWLMTWIKVCDMVIWGARTALSFCPCSLPESNKRGVAWTEVTFTVGTLFLIAVSNVKKRNPDDFFFYRLRQFWLITHFQNLTAPKSQQTGIKKRKKNGRDMAGSSFKIKKNSGFNLWTCYICCLCSMFKKLSVGTIILFITFSLSGEYLISNLFPLDSQLTKSTVQKIMDNFTKLSTDSIQSRWAHILPGPLSDGHWTLLICNSYGFSLENGNLV